MKKSQIVIAVIQKKSRSIVTETEIINRLSEHVSNFSMDLDRWDEDVEEPLANSVIKNMGSIKTDVPVRLMIREVDIILNRIMA